MSFGNSLVTTAEGAQALAEGEMDIQANPLAGIAFGKCPGDRIFPLVWIDRIVIPVRHRRIAGIARSGYIVFLDQVILH